MLQITNYWLNKAEEVKHLSCPKNKQLFAPNMPDTLIIHYTAGRDAKSSANYLCKKSVKASAHVVIGRDGTIFQLVPFNTIAWHAGISEYKGRSGFNKYAIGIELDNAGILTKVGNTYQSWFGAEYPANQALHATHRNEKTPHYWQTYTATQIQLVEQLCELLIQHYPTISNILGHEEIAPGRKQDPGPAFPLDKLRNRLLGDRMTDFNSDTPVTEEKGHVNVSKLNIREFPTLNAQTVAPPLKQGTSLSILEQHNGWYKVKTEITGWVAAKYVESGSSE